MADSTAQAINIQHSPGAQKSKIVQQSGKYMYIHIYVQEYINKTQESTERAPSG